MDYPIRFDQCPVCGSKERIVESEVNQEIEAGRLPKGTRMPATISQAGLFNPNDQQQLLARREVPILMGFYDVCVKCGTLYCVEMQRGIGMMEPQFRKGKPFGGNTPPFFGKG